MATIRIGERDVGDGQSVYVIAEIGINHNGDLATALKLIDVAVSAGCDAVKFQKRTPHLCVPAAQRDVMRDTPWGSITYLAYKERIEFGADDYFTIAGYCRARGIDWFASCWDVPSVGLIAELKPAAMKVASASLTDNVLLGAMADTALPVILSTGMSELSQVETAVEYVLQNVDVALLQATSAYPCDEASVNLRAMATLRKMAQVIGRDIPVGYSGHERGLQVTIAAVAMGASLVERHITLDRTMWGTDHAASLEPHALHRLVRDIRLVEKAMGDGQKRVMDCERDAMRKLRGT